MDLLPRIRETVNYSRFFFLSGINRPVGSGHVATLRESILNMGILRPVIVATLDFIDGVKRTYVVDGQHLFTAIQGLNAPVRYVHIQVKDKRELIEKIAKLNASSKSWMQIDYVRAWASLKDSYKRVLKAYMEYHLPILSIVAIGMNKTERSSLAITVKRGEVEIINERFDEICKYAVESLDELQCKTSGFLKERFVISMLRYINNKREYNHPVVLERVSKHRECILAVIGDEDALYSALAEKVFY
jgi:hypothetical protein